MAIKSGRTSGVAEVSIDYDRCIGCQLCVKVCKGAPLYWENGRVNIDQTRGFGCFGCGHCIAICPQACISVNGRCFSADDVLERPDATSPASYDQLFDLMVKRRSIRSFSDKEVSRADIDKILAAAVTAPMGIPPSEVGVVVLAGRAKVAAFAADLLTQIRHMNRLLSSPFVYITRPFMGKEAFDTFTSFVPILFTELDKADQRGEDGLFFNAPLVMVFHAASFMDPADSLIAATYAMLAAESLGLGSCMIGTVAPVMKNSKKLKEKYGMPVNNRPGLAIIFGHPAIQYRRNLRRTFASIHTHGDFTYSPTK